MLTFKPHALVGLAGVAEDEPEQARKSHKRFEQALLPIVFILVLQWHFEMANLMSGSISIFINVVVWGFFVTETFMLYRMVHNKKRYLRTNWLNVIVIFSGITLLTNHPQFDALLCFVRPILFIALLFPWLETFVKWLSDTSLLTTLGTFFIVLVLFGVIISAVDPAVKTPLDGIWYALVTVTTVGYGDIVPVSLTGRFIGAILILTGMGLFAALTGNFSALFVKRGMREEMKLVREGNAHIKTVVTNLKLVKDEEDEILSKLIAVREEEHNIIERLDAVKAEEDYILRRLEVGKSERGEMMQLLQRLEDRMRSLEQKIAASRP